MDRRSGCLAALVGLSALLPSGVVFAAPVHHVTSGGAASVRLIATARLRLTTNGALAGMVRSVCGGPQRSILTVTFDPPFYHKHYETFGVFEQDTASGPARLILAGGGSAGFEGGFSRTGETDCPPPGASFWFSDLRTQHVYMRGKLSAYRPLR